MIRFLKWIFTGDSHLHKWVQIDLQEVTNWRYQEDTRPRSIHHVYVNRCEICGQIMAKTIHL